MQPKPMAETSMPPVPSVRFCICAFLPVILFCLRLLE
jgi:hypothetical protein